MDLLFSPGSNEVEAIGQFERGLIRERLGAL